MVHTALLNRNDLLAEKANIETSEVSSVATKNGLLPQLQLLAGTSDAGAAGTAKIANIDGFTFGPNPYFVGGIGKALGQVFRRDFPSENVGGFTVIPLHNRAAQADFAIDRLAIRQSQLEQAKDNNQAQVDVLNAVVFLRQSRARYDAAVRARVLDEQLLDSEQKKFNLGASTPFNVIQQQRDLVAAQSTEIAALVRYSNAKVNLDQTLGTTLETNHIAVADARTGKVAQTSTLRATLP
jgi:outer membrane protein TolC